jgi:hypothetical protein
MSEQEIEGLIEHGNALSLVLSSRWKISLAVGPIRFVNSHCKPNCALVSRDRKIIRAYALSRTHDYCPRLGVLVRFLVRS